MLVKQTEKINKQVYAAILATGLMSFSGVIVETAMNITFPTLIMPSRKSRDFSHGMDRLTQRPFGRFFFWSALYF